MDADKLNEAAENHFMTKVPYFHCSDAVRSCVDKAFKSGAEWLKKQSLADRLTDEEKEKIKAIYFRNVYSIADVQSNFTEKCLIDAIFGKELFK